MALRPATVLFYAQGDRGLGHVSRVLAVATRILASYEDVGAVILTPSRMPEILKLPTNCDFLKLPRSFPWPVPGETQEERKEALHRLGEPFAQLSHRYKTLRRQLLLDAAVGLVPDLVVVDHVPLGFGKEFEEGLRALKKEHPASRLLYLMQDFVGDPPDIRRRWHRQGIHDALETLYDDIVVCSSPQVSDAADDYGFSPVVRSKLHYSGYIVRDLPCRDRATVRRRYGLSLTGRVVVVTVGGGMVGFPLLDAALEALKQLRREDADLEAILVTGPLMWDKRAAELQARAEPGIQVLRETDTYQLMVAADAVIAMSGYNTVAEALTLACPLILAPLEPIGWQTKEQLMRAEFLHDRGLARSVPIAGISPEAIVEALQWALSWDRAEYAQNVQNLGLTFDGASWLAQYVAPFLFRDQP